MHNESPQCRKADPDGFAFQDSKSETGPGNAVDGNSADEVVGEIGRLLLVILGTIVAINMLLVGLNGQ